MTRIELISASAGSGKTYRLADALERAVTKENVRPGAILATTFTRKAAAELQERVRTRLLHANRVEDALALAGARIGTVNSVAGALVQPGHARRARGQNGGGHAMLPGQR